MYGSVYYYYITNLQGDVMSIVDGSGNVVASYEYDPYGNVIEAAGILAEINPLRYRGYVYDSETDFYYCQSRYYDPQIGRFINADAYASTGQGIVGNNMFAYCNNSPVNGCDPCGSCFHRLDFWNDCEKCGGKTIAEKWDDYCENGLTAVFTVGAYGSANLGAYNVTGTFEFAFDFKGNIQIVGSTSFDVTSSGSLSASGGVTGSVFVMPDTSYLAGDTYYTGGSIFVPNPTGVNSVGLGGNFGVTSDGYWGVNGSLGLGTTSAVGVDVHGGYTTTTALTEQFNVIDWIISLFS